MTQPAASVLPGQCLVNGGPHYALQDSAASLPELEFGFSWETLRTCLSVALLCDALDQCGLPRQSPRLPLQPITLTDVLLIGRAKTTLWADMAHEDPRPYELELAAVDSSQPNDVFVCAAGGSMRSGIWGELLSHAARQRGCVGVIVDGAVRDVSKMKAQQFPVFARGTSPYDSKDRQRVIDFDVPVEWDGVTVRPGDLVAADLDGVVVVPAGVADRVVQLAWEKSRQENQFRDAVRAGMSTSEAFARYGVL